MTTRVTPVSIAMASDRIAYIVDDKGRLWKTTNIRAQSVTWEREEQLPEDPDAEPETPKGKVKTGEPASTEPETTSTPAAEKDSDGGAGEGTKQEAPLEGLEADEQNPPAEVKKPVAKKKAGKKKSAKLAGEKDPD